MPEIVLPVRDYDLDATLDSGQVFRWRQNGDTWTGILGGQVLWLTRTAEGIKARTAAPVRDWTFLRTFLQSEVNLAAILKTFPDDEPMRAAVAACRGLRLLRQDPWECLASFILSSTKQIVQIRQIVELLCERFGEPSDDNRCPALVSRGEPNQVNGGRHYRFPSPSRLAASTELELRECKMGFRAKSLLNAARQVAAGDLDLESLRRMDYEAAREKLMELHGVGGKIADCVLLFAYGFDSAFPVDVWVERALQELYFPRRRASEKRIRQFANTYFGPHAGYAQQYLFHYMRTKQTPS